MLARLEFAGKRGFNVVREVIDDIVFSDLDPFFLGQSLGTVVGHDVETDDDGVYRRGQSELHIAFGDAADRRMEDADAHLVMLELFQLLADRLDRAAEVGFKDDFQLGDLCFAQLFQPHRLALDQARFLLLGFAFVRDFAGLGQVRGNGERVVGVGHIIEAGDADRYAGPRLFHGVAQIVIHGSDPAVGSTAKNDVAAVQRSFADEQRRQHAFPFAEHGLQNGAGGRLVRVSF